MQTGFIFTKIEVENITFTVLVTQLNGINNDIENNIQELVLFTHEKIINNETNEITYQAKDSDPIILMGDLMMNSSHNRYQFLTKIYQDTYSTINSSFNGFTYPNPVPNERRDFIFITNLNETDISIKNSYPIDSVIFKHLPLFTNLLLNSSIEINI